MNLRPTQAMLAGVALLALALTGLPFFLVLDAPQGALRGLVIDERGFGVRDAPVFLFSEESRSLVAETRTDARGNFAFALGAVAPRVLARAPAGSALLPSWSPPAADLAQPLAFVLHVGRPLLVRVRDALGNPVGGAEVRVYEPGDEPAVVGWTQTDERGLARLSAPSIAHVRVTAPDLGHLSRWRFDLVLPPEESELSFTLPPVRLVRGVVRDADGPLAKVLVLAREEGSEGAWNAFVHSDAEGRFELPFSHAPGEVLALDPSARYLSARLAFALPPSTPIELQLERGAPLVVRATRNGEAIAARYWSWSPEFRTWSWGVRGDGSGPATLPVREPFGVHADPLDPSWLVPDAWDLSLEEGPLVLEAVSAR